MIHLLKKDRIRKHSALFARWITLFSIMVFIALLIMGVYFYRMNSVLENNLKNYNEAKVKQISKEIDAAGVKLSVAAYDITAKIPAEGDELASSVEARKRLIKEVANHIILNRSISSIFIYLPETDEIVSSQGIVKNKYFYAGYLNNSLMSEKEWKAFLSDDRSDCYCCIPFSGEEGRGDYKYTYVIRFDGGVVLVSLDAYSILKLDPYFSDMFILDKEGTISAVYGKKHGGAIPENAGETEETAENYVTVADSFVPYVSYVIYTDKNLLNKNLSKLQILSVAYMLLFLIVGLTLAYYFAFRQYKPLRSMLKRLNQALGDRTEEHKNEYAEIESRIYSIVNEKAVLLKEMHKSEAYIREYAVENLLNGKPLSGEMRKLIDAGSERICAIRILHSDENPLYDNDRELFRFAVKNVAGEVFSPVGKVFFSEFDSGTNAVIFVKDEYDSSAASLMLAEQSVLLRSVMHDMLETEITVVIGDIADKAEKLPNIYRSIIEESFSVTEYGQIIRTRLTDSDSGLTGTLDIQSQMQISYYLKKGESEKASVFVGNMLAKLTERKNYPITLLRCYIIDVMNTIIRTEEEIGSDAELQLNYGEDMGKLLSSDTLTGMQEVIDKYIETVCKLAKSGGRMNAGICDEIKAYIKENLSDVNLNVNDLAARFHFNPAYLSSMFRKNTGVKLLDYINKVRIDEAKRLMLENPALSIEQVTEMTGFGNSRTFRRIFKSLEDMSPSQFRK